MLVTRPLRSQAGVDEAERGTGDLRDFYEFEGLSRRQLQIFNCTGREIGKFLKM